MSANIILDRIAAEQGWSAATQLELALRYIDFQGSNDAFRDFLLQQQDAEEELVDELRPTSASRTLDALIHRLSNTTLHAINMLSREQCVTILEGHGIQCYDNETYETLIRAVKINIADGTIGSNVLDGEPE